MIDSALDQSVPVRNIRHVLGEIDNLITQALMDQDDSVLIDKALNITETMQISGVSLAKLLSEWKKNTRAFGVHEDDWEDYVFSTTGRSHQTIRKYVDVWENVISPHPELANKPMQGLLLLTAAAKEQQLDDDAWKKVENAVDPHSIRDIVREARGKQTSSESAIRLVLDRAGMLHCYQSDKHDVIGYLKPEQEILTDFGKAAMTRIINSAGIMLE